MAAALVLAAGCAGAQHPKDATPPVALDYGAAWQQAQARSERLAAARSATEGKARQAEGLKRFGGPTVSLTGA
ncbi:MAG: transporter, partial [Burkholderiaceae bacterium]